jgi:uncharacterized protein
MPALAAIALLLTLALIYGPQFWIRRTMQKHAAERPDFPGTGGELARHLLDQAELKDVKVEQTGFLQDHYSPVEKIVRLSKENFEGRSVTAVAVAAHEVAHAIQDKEGYWPLVTRHRLMKQLIPIQRIASIVLMAAPFVFAFTRSPTVLLLEIVAGLGIMASTVLVHVFTLPTEFDASFKRALPALENFIDDEDQRDARKVLRAAAFTYVAGALANLLNILRWARRF